MRTYVINLDVDAQRWLGVRRKLESAGLSPLRQPAVCGVALDVPSRAALYSEALNRAQYHRPLSAGEVGCYASHQAVWRRLLESGDGWALVFEDDVDIVGPLAPVLDAFDSLPRDWDLIKLIGRRVEKIERRMPLAAGVELVSYRRVPSLTGAYAITRRGAQALLSSRAQFGRPVDVDMRYWWECDLTVLGVQPYPVVEDPIARHSTIEGRQVDADLAMRCRKLALQLHYSLANWRARQARRRLPAPQPEFDLQARRK